MEYIIIGLFAFAVILLLLSFISVDRVKVLEEQVDQLSMTHLQETYIIKKKLKALEEELLIETIEHDKYRGNVNE